MKEKILKLRSEGKTYNEIVKELGCSKGTVAYHCGEGQVEKSKLRGKRNRKKDILKTKVHAFKSRKLYYAIRDFQEKDINLKGKRNPALEKKFNVKEVLLKIGENPKCYLSGIEIDLENNNYHLDHINPVSKGGDNSIDNLGILTRDINQMKHDLSVEQVIYYSKLILENNGYKVTKIK